MCSRLHYCCFFRCLVYFSVQCRGSCDRFVEIPIPITIMLILSACYGSSENYHFQKLYLRIPLYSFDYIRDQDCHMSKKVLVHSAPWVLVFSNVKTVSPFAEVTVGVKEQNICLLHQFSATIHLQKSSRLSTPSSPKSPVHNRL